MLELRQSEISNERFVIYYASKRAIKNYLKILSYLLIKENILYLSQLTKIKFIAKKIFSSVVNQT